MLPFTRGWCVLCVWGGLFDLRLPVKPWAGHSINPCSMSRRTSRSSHPSWQLSFSSERGSSAGSGSLDTALSSDSSASTGSSDQSTDNDEDIVFPKPTTEDCRFESHDAATNCSTYRMCDSCLRKHGCRIGIDGYCELDVYESNFSASNDYRIAFNFNLSLPRALKLNASALYARQAWIFRASDATYCPSDDNVCQRCVRRHFWLPNTTDSRDSRFCVGNSEIDAARVNCVCIANCVRSGNSTYCPPTTLPAENKSKHDWWSHGWITAALVTLTAVVCFALFWGGIRCIRRRRAQRREQSMFLEALLARPGEARPTIPADGYFEEESGRSIEI